jgi:hypothetical protein
MGEWAPLFYPPFQPYPPLHIPQGVSHGTCFAWQVIDQGHDGQGTGHRQATGQAIDGTQAGPGNYPTDRSVY